MKENSETTDASVVREAFVTLHVEVKGSGPDLVLLHGWATNAAVWNAMVPALARQFRLHCVDLPGHGTSVACAPYELELLSETLAMALPKRIMVCGWSLGAQVALDWARRKPEQVKRVMLFAATPRFVRGPGWDCGIDAAVLDGFALGLERDYRAALQRFLALVALGSDARGVLRRLRVSLLAHGEPDVAALAAGLRLLKQTDLRDWLDEITQPALILHGERDSIVPLAAGKYLHRALPQARLEVLPEMGHAPFLAQPQQIARRIMEFCREP